MTGKREIVIDCSGVASPGELWERYLDAAEHEDAALFGRNLDAFWDAVEGGGQGCPREVKLIFAHSDQLSALHMDGGTSFHAALRQIAAEASLVGTEFR